MAASPIVGKYILQEPRILLSISLTFPGLLLFLTSLRLNIMFLKMSFLNSQTMRCLYFILFLAPCNFLTTCITIVFKDMGGNYLSNIELICWSVGTLFSSLLSHQWLLCYLVHTGWSKYSYLTTRTMKNELSLVGAMNIAVQILLE